MRSGGSNMGGGEAVGYSWLRGSKSRAVVVDCEGEGREVGERGWAGVGLLTS